MILLSYIMLGHPAWKKSDIRIFQIYQEEQFESLRKAQEELLNIGRLPITKNNIEWIREEPHISFKSLVNERSKNAGLTLIGFGVEQAKHDGKELFLGYDQIGQTLFIHSNQVLDIS